MALAKGTQAPDFTLISSDKEEVTLSSFKGQNVVLLFFPLAFTGGCTTEICTIRDSIASYNSLNAQVLGISSDSALDSASNFYIFNSAGARRFKLHDGRASGEVKRFINRRNIDITLEVNPGRLETFAGTFNQVTIGEKMAFTCLWDGIGQQWYVDRDSDIHLVFA